ncbi:CRISPR-associated protein Cas7 [Rufibacter psychrotolerans]|uniref:CRISPR-associated protein Cas7 n=1 Tax=Rufibacter psychrotolerans TaxID=2812556 RepID=UPI0019675016|nr:CRISPR-associated protein Cas7 [Rufibacter sp. SYSU D00308]
MNHFIYFRALKHANHTVFCVEKGQKTFRDAQFGRSMAYSSGQQVKRSILEAIISEMNVPFSPTTFTFNIDKSKKLGEGEAWSACNPVYVDQLLGGWMKAEVGGESRTLKRRSPFSISAMRPLHPLLATYIKEDLTFDRSDRPESHKVIVKDVNGNTLSEEEVQNLLAGTNRSLHRKWVPENARTTGLFVHDIALDLRTLFAVSINKFEPEISPETEDLLRAAGWIEGETVFGKCLIAPKELREKIIPAIANALINWRITTNQSRTFSLMETLAIAISPNANKLAAAIRTKLKEDEDKVEPIVDDSLEDVRTFISLPAAGYIRTNTESADALDKAEEHLIELLQNYPYEAQLQEIVPA